MAAKGRKEISGEATRRRYPRAGLSVKVRLSVGSGDRKRFEATLSTRNISVSGMFFESTFFLKVGQVLDVELRLPPKGRVVRARGRVVRVETLEEGSKARGGVALKFEEYEGSSDVVLANYFLAPALRQFIEGYARKNKLRAPPDYVEQVVDILSAWELSKMNQAEDDALWRERK
jgi:hypothetical protein